MSGQDFELRLKMSECQIRYGLHDAVVRMNVISGAATPRLQFRLMQQVDEAVRSARKQSFCLEMISALNPTCFHLIPTSIEPCVHHDCRCLRSSKDLGAVTAYSYQRRREGWPKRRGSLRLFCAEPSAVLTSHASSFSLSPPCIYALLNLFLSLDCSLSSACMKGVLDHCVVLSISWDTCKLLEVPNQSMS